MKKGLVLASVALGVAVSVAGLGAERANADPAARQTVMKPRAGVSFDLGAQHAVGHFVAAKGACNLVVVVADRAKTDDEITVAGQRVAMALQPGRAGRVDTADGKSLEFLCGPAAQAMTARVLERTATIPASTVR